MDLRTRKSGLNQQQQLQDTSFRLPPIYPPTDDSFYVNQEHQDGENSDNNFEEDNFKNNDDDDNFENNDSNFKDNDNYSENNNDDNFENKNDDYDFESNDDNNDDENVSSISSQSIPSQSETRNLKQYDCNDKKFNFSGKAGPYFPNYTHFLLFMWVTKYQIGCEAFRELSNIVKHPDFNPNALVEIKTFGHVTNRLICHTFRPNFVRLSGGLPKYRNSKDSFGRSGGLPKYGKNSQTDIIYNLLFLFGRSGGLLKYRNPKDSFGRSGGLPKYGKTKFRSDVPKNGKIPRFVRVCFRVPKNRKIPRFDLVGFQRTENQETKIRKIGWASEERKPKDSIGFRWASEVRKPKDKDSFRWASEERKPKDKDSLGVSEFPKNESPKDSFVNRKPRFVSFGKSGTKIRLVSQADSKEQKKTKDSFGGFPKN
ncbi:unnamed protein product [Rhizophagus irregularis]|nr:unnamed protein product [Rhizophagus irregularis]